MVDGWEKLCTVAMPPAWIAQHASLREQGPGWRDQMGTPFYPGRAKPASALLVSRCSKMRVHYDRLSLAGNVHCTIYPEIRTILRLNEVTI